MRFKVDENLPIDAAELLRANGHDAMTIFDQQMVGEPDPKVASVCKAEERAIITLDLDFSDIRTYPPSAYPGIIILRPRTQSKPDVLALLDKLIPLLGGREPLAGNLWIVQENGIRIREGSDSHGSK
jgi:predicted nuclease of predicted toxin-antitoxin system